MINIENISDLSLDKFKKYCYSIAFYYIKLKDISFKGHWIKSHFQNLSSSLDIFESHHSSSTVFNFVRIYYMKELDIVWIMLSALGFK